MPEIPNTLPIPKIIVERLASLSGSDLKVLLAVCYATLGLKRSRLTVQNFCHMTGLSSATIVDTIKGLEDEWLEKEPDGKSFTYAMRFAEEEVKEDDQRIANATEALTNLDEVGVMKARSLVSRLDGPYRIIYSDYLERLLIDRAKENKYTPETWQYKISLTLLKTINERGRKVRGDEDAIAHEWAVVFESIHKMGYSIDALNRVVSYLETDDFWIPKGVIRHPITLKKKSKRTGQVYIDMMLDSTERVKPPSTAAFWNDQE